jgi:hypothetical protein
VFSVVSTPKLYNEDPRPTESVEFRDGSPPGCELGRRGVERWNLRKWGIRVSPQCSVDSRAVKRRLRGSCEMAASLGPSQWVISAVELCKGGCGDRIWAREAEESPLLEAVARERLVKTGWKRFSGCYDYLWTVEISDSAVITCSSESCIQVDNSSIHQSIPRL